MKTEDFLCRRETIIFKATSNKSVGSESSHPALIKHKQKLMLMLVFAQNPIPSMRLEH